jgi:hypothetical protein
MIAKGAKKSPAMRKKWLKSVVFFYFINSKGTLPEVNVELVPMHPNMFFGKPTSD